MDPIKIIEKYYKVDSVAYNFLVIHSKSVTKKALEIAKHVAHLNPDIQFIQEAAMLHDIGIFLTHAPDIWCFGDKPYICHTYLGREILEKEWFPKHALVCERHLGIGLSIQDIEKQNLPLPKREMMPISIEEKIICFADKFFSKSEEYLIKERSIENIKQNNAKFRWEKIKIFDEWIQLFLQ